MQYHIKYTNEEFFQTTFLHLTNHQVYLSTAMSYSSLTPCLYFVIKSDVVNLYFIWGRYEQKIIRAMHHSIQTRNQKERLLSLLNM